LWIFYNLIHYVVKNSSNEVRNYMGTILMQKERYDLIVKVYIYNNAIWTSVTVLKSTNIQPRYNKHF